MKIRHNILSMALILILVTLLSGCVGGKADSRLVGKWELAEDVTLMGFYSIKKGTKLEFYKNGKVDFLGASSRYEVVENKIRMYDEEGESYHEYELEGDKLILYVEATSMFSNKTIPFEFVRVDK